MYVSMRKSSGKMRTGIYCVFILKYYLFFARRIVLDCSMAFKSRGAILDCGVITKGMNISGLIRLNYVMDGDGRFILLTDKI